MKIAFVRPNLRATRAADAMEPLCFAVLQSLTPPDVDTVLHDERLAPIPFDRPIDLAALTVETYTARRAYQIAIEYRRRGVPVVMGGYHPTFLPEEALQFADAVVRGDAEGLWERVVADAADGRLQRVYQQDGYPPLGGRLPDRTIFAGKRYAPMTLVQYGRGCRYACDFCSIRAYYGASLRQRPVAEVVREIEETGRKHVFLVDDNIFVDIPKAKALFRALVPLNIRWSCQVSIDVARDRELMALMQRSGCISAVIGFESLDPDNLRQMKKGWNLKYGTYSDAIAAFHDAGIMIYGSFVLGYDHDTVASFDRVTDFAVEHKFCLGNFNPLTPTPETALSRRLEREGRLIYDRWWLDPAFRYGDATFQPRGMTADELTAGCARARREFNTWRCITRRAMSKTHLRSPFNLGVFVLANRISRSEVRTKQSRPLGEPTPPVPYEAAPS